MREWRRGKNGVCWRKLSYFAWVEQEGKLMWKNKLTDSGVRRLLCGHFRGWKEGLRRGWGHCRICLDRLGLPEKSCGLRIWRGTRRRCETYEHEWMGRQPIEPVKNWSGLATVMQAWYINKFKAALEWSRVRSGTIVWMISECFESNARCPRDSSLRSRYRCK